jgi:DNA-binding IclR family transcriptional regulator
MAASLLTRALGVIELLVQHARGLPLQTIADELSMPKSGAHRLLAELSEHGYVAQAPDTGLYLLTTRLSSLGMRHLASCGVIDVAQPGLDQLAQFCGELVRLAVVDGDRLVYIAKAQGALSGLRYDPESGGEATLYCTSTAFAWLSTFSDDEAIRLIAAQGEIRAEEHGPNCPRGFAEVLPHLEFARQHGYGKAINCWLPGMSAIAANVTDPASGRVVGVLSIGGPSVRLTETVIDQYVPHLLSTAAELSVISPLSDYLRSLSVRRLNRR